jgi:toxin YoeB
MGNLVFLPEGWDDYLYWQNQDKKTVRRVNQLLQDIVRNGYEGIGKPEPLRNNRTGWWSRRIDDTNRLVYRIRNDGDIEIAQCRGHYGDS